MMKKLLLSIGFALFATVASMAQFENAITNVVFPASAEVGEEITVTFDYVAVDPGFFRFVISNNADAATFWDAKPEGGDNFFGVNDWANLLDAPVGEVVGASITFKIPSTIEPGTRLFKLRLEESTAVNLLDYDGEIEITEAAFSGLLTEYIAPTVDVKVGEEIDVPVVYTSDFPTGQDLAFFFVSAGIDGGEINWADQIDGDNTAPGNHGFAPIAGVLVEGTDVNYTGTVLVPSSIEFGSADLPAGQEWRLGVKAFDKDLITMPITIVLGDEALNTISVTGVVTENGSSISADDSVAIDYELTSTEDAVIEFSIVLFEQDGFTEVIPNVTLSNVLYLPGITASADRFDVKTGTVKVKMNSDLATLSADLTNGEQYMAVAKLLHGDETTNVYQLQDNFGLLITGLFNNKFESASFTAYPNPSANGTVRFSTEISNMIVVDAIGNVVETAASATEVNTSSLESGFYLLKSDQGSVRLVVE